MLLELPAIPVISVVLLLLLLVVTLMSRLKRHQLNLPHPKGWPLVGNALQMTKYGRSDQTLQMWAKQYGGIFSVQIFNMTWVILSGYDEIYEALVQKSRVFAGRYKWFRASWVSFNSKSISLGNPTRPQWLPMRKALHRTIQPIGNNLNRIEIALVEMAQQFVSKVKSYDGTEVDFEDDIYNFVAKVAVIMVTGQNLDDSSELLRDIKVFNKFALEVISPISGIELDFFPWLRFFGHPV